MPAAHTRPRRRLRIALFKLVLALAPLLVLLAAEAAARLLWSATERDPFLALPGRTSALTRTVVDGEPVFRFTHPDAYAAESGTTFPVRKAPGSLRVVCFGGSANAGWPHRPPQRWTDYLERALNGAFPGRKHEVINLGAHACASYRVRMILADAMACAPDVVVIYSGNNEFVEKRSYLLDFPGRRIVDALRRSSVLIAKAAEWWTAWRAPANALSGAGRQHVHEHLWTHTERIAAELRSDPEQYEQVKAHYRYSITQMVEEAERRGARVFVLTVPVNLRDWSPAVSADEVGDAAAARFAAAYRAGCAHLLRGDPAAALPELAAAVQLAPEHADAHFQRARALDRLGRFAEAHESYARALDTDRNPFRAARPLNAILAEVVAAHPGAELVDAVAAFRAAAADGIPGFDLLLDYVHPTRQGNLVLANVVFDAFVRAGVVGAAEFALADDGYRDEDDPSLQLSLLALFGIMHQYEAYLAKADAFTALLARGGQPLPEAARNVIANTRAEFASFLAERRKEILGEPFAADYRERHAAFYRQFFLFASDMKGALVQPGWQPAGSGR